MLFGRDLVKALGKKEENSPLKVGNIERCYTFLTLFPQLSSQRGSRTQRSDKHAPPQIVKMSPKHPTPSVNIPVFLFKRVNDMDTHPLGRLFTTHLLCKRLRTHTGRYLRTERLSYVTKPTTITETLSIHCSPLNLNISSSCFPS